MFQQMVHNSSEGVYDLIIAVGDESYFVFICFI